MLEGVDSEGNAIMIPEIEDIHTFAAWKSLGFKVKKGEHAIARFSIWKYSAKEIENDNGEKETKTSMFLKDACWFTRGQVEPIGGVA